MQRKLGLNTLKKTEKRYILKIQIIAEEVGGRTKNYRYFP